MSILDVQDVTSGYGEVQILWGASLKLEPGKMTSLVGANGAGKTTLLRTVMGLIKPRSGSVTFDGQDVSHVSAHAKADIGLILVPEGRQLFSDMSVEENLEMGAAPARARSEYATNLEKVYAIFPRLKERRQQKARTLSGGEAWAALVAGAEGEVVLSGSDRDASPNRLDLLAALAALEGLPEGASAAVRTPSDYLRKGAAQWLPGWRRRGWRTASGSAVQNADLWRRLAAVLERRRVAWPEAREGASPTSDRLEEALERELDRG